MNLTTYARDGRDNNFHLIRHLAAGAVVLTHSYSVVTGVYASEPLVGLFGSSIGHYAVRVFFVLSGFLIAQSITANPDLLRFAVSRLLRVFPALIIAVALSSLVLGPMLTVYSTQAYFADPDLARYIVGSLSTLVTDNSLPGLFAAQPEAGNVNEPLWTLKYEIAAYCSIVLVVALSIALREQVLPYAAAMVIAASLASFAALPSGELPAGVSNALNLFLSFYMGVAAYLLRQRVALTSAGVVLLAGFAVLAHSSFLAAFCETLFIAYAVMWFAFLPGLPTRKLESLGDASYGIYIYAFPIQQTLRFFFPQIDPLTLFAAALAITTPLAFASWHAIEKPCLESRQMISSFIAYITTRLSALRGRTARS